LKPNEPISQSECFIVNRYAASELAGGLLIGKMARKVKDSYLRTQLAWHCAEETRHALIWYKLMDELGIPSIEIHDSNKEDYFSYVQDKVENIIDFLACVHVYELRVPFHFGVHLKWTKNSKIQTVLMQLIKEEDSHLSWIRDFLYKEKKNGNNGVSISLKKFADIENITYYKDLERLEKIGNDAKELVKNIRLDLAKFERERENELSQLE